MRAFFPPPRNPWLALALVGLFGTSAFAQPSTDRHGVTSQLFSAPDTNIQGGEAWADFDLPFTEVEAAVHDYARYHEFLPHFEASRILAQRGSRARVYLEVSILRTATLWANLDIRSRMEDGVRVVEGRMTEGNVDRFYARWELRPLDGGRRTAVKFRILVLPDLPVPAAVMMAENLKSARQSVRKLRARVTELRD